MKVFLDDLQVSSNRVGYGRLGLGGRLGYEEKPVVHRNELIPHAVSAHPPSFVEYVLGQAYSRFSVVAAINEDIPLDKQAEATFIVKGDGQELARAVVNNQNHGEISVDVSSVSTLRLEVEPVKFAYCHAVWVNPWLEPKSLTEQPDCLGRTTIDTDRSAAALSLKADRALVTICSAGFDGWLQDMLTSLYAVGGCTAYPLIVFMVDADQACLDVACKFPNVHLIYGRSLTPRNPGLKSAMYSVGRLVPGVGAFLCLDADMIVYSSLAKIFDVLDVGPRYAVAACRDIGNRPTLGGALEKAYKSSKDEFSRTFGVSTDILHFPFVLNDGLFASSGEALRVIDTTIRNWPEANAWTYAHPKCTWRNQFVFNLALAVNHEIIPLDPAFNVQLHKMAVTWGDSTPYWQGQPARVLHFTGPAKQQLKSYRRLPPNV